MQKVPAVEEIKALLGEGTRWGVWKWLTEKRHVREVADQGSAALDNIERAVKNRWSNDLKKAYAELTSENLATADSAAARRKYEKARKNAEKVDAKIKLAARRVKEADDLAHEARMTAERMFEGAERRLSANMAREAAHVAIEAYELREKAIRKAEAAARLE